MPDGVLPIAIASAVAIVVAKVVVIAVVGLVIMKVFHLVRQQPNRWPMLRVK